MENFKIGDWITANKGKTLHKIDKIIDNRYVYFTNESSYLIYDDMELLGIKLWKPEKNTLCWFWNKEEYKKRYKNQ